MGFLGKKKQRSGAFHWAGNSNNPKTRRMLPFSFGVNLHLTRWCKIHHSIPTKPALRIPTAFSPSDPFPMGFRGRKVTPKYSVAEYLQHSILWAISIKENLLANNPNRIGFAICWPDLKIVIALNSKIGKIVANWPEEPDFFRLDCQPVGQVVIFLPIESPCCTY